jgi:hypothetical protein
MVSRRRDSLAHPPDIPGIMTSAHQVGLLDRQLASASSPVAAVTTA